MLRINMNDNIEYKIELYKNRREKIAEIPLDYVEDITYKFNDIDEMSLNVPQFIASNGTKRLNRLYKIIKTRQTIIVTSKNKNGQIKQQKFVLYNRGILGNSISGNKSFTAYSFEKTIERDKLTLDPVTRQLTNKDDAVNVGEGILDLICKKIGWKVGYVDQDARTVTSMAVEEFPMNLVNNLNVNKVTENSLIFEKNVSINTTTKPINLMISYNALKVFDENGNMLSDYNIQNKIDTPLYTSLRKIQAYHYSEAGNRFAIRYIFTLSDGVQISQVCTFSNCINKKLTAETVNLVYDYGDVVERTNIRYVNFEAFNDNAYKYLKDIQDMFECQFEFDTMTNTINTYAFKNLNKNSGYPLCMGENVIEVKTTEDENIPTILRVESENANIIDSNPIGTDYIENYNYYIKNNIISDSLENALKEYDKISKNLYDQWLVLKNDKMLCEQKKTKAQSELKSLTERIKSSQALLSSYFGKEEFKERQEQLKIEIEQLEARQAQLLREMSSLETQINNIQEQVNTINSKGKKENMVNESGVKIFSEDDLLELNDIKEVEVLSDTYYTTSYGLYNYSQSYLADLTTPKITFDLTCIDLVNIMRNPKGWNNILELGNLFPVEKNDYIEEDEIRLTEMKLKPVKGENKVKSESFKFSNKRGDFKYIKTGHNIGKTTNKSTSKMISYNQLWEDSKLTNNFVSEMITRGLNIASSNIRGGVYRNELDFSEAGMFITNVVDGNKDNQIYIGGGAICFTVDSWKHCETAIDSNGIIARQLVGEILVSEKLIINNTGGTFYIGNGENYATDEEFGLSIYDDLKSGRTKRIFLGISRDSDGVKRAKLRLIGKDGELTLSEDGILSEYQFPDRSEVDANAPMYSYFRLSDNIGSFKKCLLSIKLRPFRVYSKGMGASGAIYSNVTSSDGGFYSTSVTSNSVDNHRHVMFQKADKDIKPDLEGTYVASTSGGSFSAMPINLSYNSYSSGTTNIWTAGANGSHNHSTSFNVPNHTHDFTINVSGHVHDESYGCFDLGGSDNYPSNVTLKVNGNIVATEINSDCEIDIKNYLVKNSLNEIELSSSTRGYIHIHVYNQSFIRW